MTNHANALKWLPVSADSPAFAEVMAKLFPAYPAASHPARSARLALSAVNLSCYDNVSLIRLAIAGAVSPLAAHYALMGPDFVHYCSGDGTDLDDINSEVSPGLPEEAEEYVRLALLLTFRQNGVLVEQQQAEAKRRRVEGATLKELARSYDVSPATISRITAGI